MQQASGHTLKAFDEDIDRLRAPHQPDGRPCRTCDRRGDALPHPARHRGRPARRRERQEARRARDRDRAPRGPADRAARADGRPTFATSSRRSRSRAWSSASAIMPRTSPSASRCSKMRARSSPCRCFPKWRGSRPGWSTTCSTHSSSAMREAALRVCERDQAVDDFYDSIFRTLLTHMMENPHNIGQSAHLLFVAKNLERVGDHATNIAEMVYYRGDRRAHGRSAASRIHSWRVTDDG